MSDPVSNAEIEDVLSSIRRLVSVDHRGEAGLGVKVERQDQVSHDDDQDIENDAELDDKVDPADVPDVTVYEEGSGALKADSQGLELGTTGAKLVLTQALRVDGEDNEDEAFEGQSEDVTGDFVDAEATHSSEDHEDADQSFDDHEEHEPLGEGDDPLKAPEAGSDFTRLRPEVTARDWIRGAVTGVPVVAAPEPEGESWPEEHLQAEGSGAELHAIAEADEAEDWTEEDLQEEPQESEQHAESDPEFSTQRDQNAPAESELEARIAEVEAAVAARSEQWDPDAAEQDDYAGGEVEPLPWEDHGSEDDAVEASEHVEEKSSEEVDAIEEAVVLDEPVTLHEPAEPEVDAFAEAVFDSSREPAADPEPATEPEPLNLADVAMSEEVTETVYEAVTESAAETVADAAWYSEDTVIDENALRDLVGEIVRQELQGALGERITRNVRKLVRREIHRAMMGQDYD